MTDTTKTDTTNSEAVARALRVAARLRREDLEMILAIPNGVFREVVGVELQRAQAAPGAR
jgi:hypothetical protein